jgi:hypothetical protein
MFGSNLLDRRSRPERVADQAWEYLLSATDAAKGTARSAGRRTSHFADGTSSAVGSAFDTAGSAVGDLTDEAIRRASAAYDALAGRKQSSTPWALIAVAGLVGLAIGWAAGSASRAAMARMQDSTTERDTDEIEFVDTDRPVSSLDN